MTSPRLPLATLIAAVALASLTGCSPEPAVPTAPPAATAEPLFATDEEALAAAEAAFEEYLAVTNMVLQEGGVNPERIRPLVSDKVWESDLEDAERWQRDGLTSIGGTALETIELQQTFANAAGLTEVITYNCLSLSNVDVVDRNGRSIVSPDRPEAFVVEAVVGFASELDWTIEDYETTETVESCDL